MNKEVDPGLIATLEQEVIPWLEAHLAQTPEPQQRFEEYPHAHRLTVVFDREGYSPELFRKLRDMRIAVLTYRKFPQTEWREEEFHSHEVRLQGGQVVTMQLAERGAQLSNRMWVREIRKRSEQGHQTAILSTNFQTGLTAIAAAMFARWCQENFFCYMRQRYGVRRVFT